MIFKQTKLLINDTSGFLTGRVFHIYSKKKYIISHGFTYASIRETYLRFKHFIGKKRKMYVIRTKKNKQRFDGTNINYISNDTLVIKKRTSIIGGFTKGPINYNIRRKKLLSSFNTTILCLI